MKIEINGLTLNYLDEGTGIPILLLHGWGCNSGHWAPVTAFLQEKYRVIAVDIPGFGNSDEPRAVWGSAEYADFFAAFLQHLDVEKPVVIGHSNGGRIAIFLAARGLCSRLILTDSAGIKPQRSLTYYFKVYTYKALKQLLSLPGLRGKKEEILERRRKKSGSADYQAASPRMRQILSKVVNEDLQEEISKIKVPTLLVWGSEDTATPLKDGQRMEAILLKHKCDAALVVFVGRTHYAFLEEANRFNRAVAAFIEPMEEN